MDLVYHRAAPLALVREFLADVVRVVRPDSEGPWICGSSTPLPHDGHGPLEALARTHWQLGEASLLQVVEGGVGDPRDGFGFDILFALSVPGSDGAPRTASLVDCSREPYPSKLGFILEGFTAAECSQVRAAGDARFTSEDDPRPGPVTPKRRRVRAARRT